jgi:hypothetical protein
MSFSSGYKKKFEHICWVPSTAAISELFRYYFTNQRVRVGC